MDIIIPSDKFNSKFITTKYKYALVYFFSLFVFSLFHLYFKII